MNRRKLLSGVAASALLSSGALANVINPPFGRDGAYQQGIGIPAIEVFGRALVGDGIADDSVAIKTAHDAAFAAGVREVWCSRQYNAPTAYNLGQVIFRGPGALIGTYRKKVIPVSARQIGPVAPNIVPANHLTRMAKALNPVVLIYGDSTGTTAANHINAAEMLWTMLQRAFLRDNPGRTITRVNRALGGSDVTQWNATGTALAGAGVPLQSWFTPTSANWGGFISNQTPDLIIIDWGANNGGAASVSAINAMVTGMLGLPKVPDLIFVTNNPRSTQADAGSLEVTGLEQRDYAAGAFRSFAEFYGYGCLDMHRIGCMARDGFDPTSQVNSLSVTAGVLALPATLPMTQSDFDLVFTIDNTGGAAFGTTNVQAIDVLISATAANAIRISNTGGVYRMIGLAGGGVFWMGATNTVIAMPTGICTIGIATRGSWISIYFETALAFEGLFLRAGGQFQPTISYSVGSGASQINVISYTTSSPVLVQPVLTDGEMYGVSPFPQGGNAINHPSSLAYEAIHALIAGNATLSMAAAGLPVQTITAAAAISPLAGEVQITGPASSTYAITLAAPTPAQIGRTVMIEMIATTASNTVTLALTNVTGGTAAATCTWSAAAQKLVLLGGATKWEVIKQDGVVLT